MGEHDFILDMATVLMDCLEPACRLFVGHIARRNLLNKCSQLLGRLRIALLNAGNEVVEIHNATSNQSDFLQALVKVVSSVDGWKKRGVSGHFHEVRVRGKVNLVAWMNEHGH